MTDTATTRDDRRAQGAALGGLVIQLAMFGCLAGVAYASGSDAVAAGARLALAGLPIWFVLVLVFKQRRRVHREELETAELRRAQDAGTATALFGVDDESLLIEAHRLRWMERWLLPGTAVVVALVLVLGYFAWWGWSLEGAFGPEGVRPAKDATMWLWFVVGCGFVSFLFARYTLALSRLGGWSLLHGGASYLAGIALACLGLFIALMAGSTISWAEPLMAYVIRVGTLVLGLEFAVNFVLDFYRPRVPGEAHRPSFDSRLLGLLSEPGGIAKSIADAINYQFGFEVSGTWLYQLLQRWMLPMVGATIAVVLGLTSIVIVDADEQVVVERWGQAPGDPWDPGLHFKLPYPIDIVYRAPVRRIDEIVIGEAPQEAHDGDEALLWTEQHEFVTHLMLVVASPELVELSDDAATGPAQGARVASKSVAASLLQVSLPIQYRIKDLKAFLYTYDDPLLLMQNVAHRFLSDYAAGVDIDEIMGPGRAAFNAEIRRGIQDALDRHGVGIEIVFAGLQGAHPPAQRNVAATFQRVVASRLEKEATVTRARGEAEKILTTVAGTSLRALALDDAIQQRKRLSLAPDTTPEALAAATQRVDDLMMGNPEKGIAPITGAAAALIAHTRAKQARLVSQELAKVRAFSAEVAGFVASRRLYEARKILDVYAGLASVRKFVILGDPSKVIVEYETGEELGLDRILREDNE